MINRMLIYVSVYLYSCLMMLIVCMKELIILVFKNKEKRF